MAFSHAGVIRKADVVALPEPNRARALENHRSERECDQVLAERIETLLRIAASNGGFDAQQVIGLFEDWIRKHPGVIGRIVFAVPRTHAAAFDAAFGEPKVEEIAPVAAHEDEEDDFDLRNIELPEGVTLR